MLKCGTVFVCIKLCAGATSWDEWAPGRDSYEDAPTFPACLRSRQRRAAHGSCSAAGPDQDECVLSVGHRGQGFLHIGCVLHGVTIYFDDHVTGVAGRRCRRRCRVALARRTAPWTSLDACSWSRNSGVMSVRQRCPARFAVTIAGDFLLLCHGCPFPPASTGCWWTCHPPGTSSLMLDRAVSVRLRSEAGWVADFLAIEFGNDSPTFSPAFSAGNRFRPGESGLLHCFRSGRTWRSRVTSLMPIPHVTVSDLTVRSRFPHGGRTICGNGESHAGKLSRTRQESVDADHLARASSDGPRSCRVFMAASV